MRNISHEYIDKETSAKPIGINQEKRFSPKLKPNQNPQYDFMDFFLKKKQFQWQRISSQH